MKGHFMKWVFMVSWLISALATINVGLEVFNYNFFASEFAFMHLAAFIRPIHYLILASGLISLYLFVMSCLGHDKKGSC